MVSIEFAISSIIALVALLLSIKSLRQQGEMFYDEKTSELINKYSKKNNEINELINDVQTSLTLTNLRCDVNSLNHIFRKSAKRISLELNQLAEQQVTTHSSLIIELHAKKTKNWRKSLALSDAYAEDNYSKTKKKLLTLKKLSKALVN